MNDLSVHLCVIGSNGKRGEEIELTKTKLIPSSELNLSTDIVVGGIPMASKSLILESYAIVYKQKSYVYDRHVENVCHNTNSLTRGHMVQVHYVLAGCTLEFTVVDSEDTIRLMEKVILNPANIKTIQRDFSQEFVLPFPENPYGILDVKLTKCSERFYRIDGIGIDRNAHQFRKIVGPVPRH